MMTDARKPARTPEPKYETVYVVRVNGGFFKFDDEFRADCFAEELGGTVVAVESRVA